MSYTPPLSIGGITREGGTVERLVPNEDFIRRWEQAERIKDIMMKQIFALLERHSEDAAALLDARWDEAARLCGYESLHDARMQGISFVIVNGPREIAVIRQKEP